MADKIIRDKKTGRIIEGAPQDTNKHGTAGRPTKYTEDMPEKLLAFFKRPYIVEREITKYNKKGEPYTVIMKEPNLLPTFERFSVDYDVSNETMLNWCEKYPEFLEAYKKAKQVQKDMLNQLGMNGMYNSTYTIFVAKNITDMVDKSVQENTTKVSLEDIEDNELNERINKTKKDLEDIEDNELNERINKTKKDLEDIEDNELNERINKTKKDLEDTEDNELNERINKTKKDKVSPTK